MRAPVPAHERFQAHAESFRGLDLADTFARIHAMNLWGAETSRSGLGSESGATRHLEQAVPALLRDIGASTLLDVPCGDFAWLSRVDLRGIDYTGADIVQALVSRNEARYGGPARRFLRLDLTRDALPTADVVLCRDCLVHLSFAHIALAIERIRDSGSRYLLTTTFTGHDANADIQDGDWRLLNLERAPFHLPPPLRQIVEGCTEGNGTYRDKTLALWRVSDLPGLSSR